MTQEAFLESKVIIFEPLCVPAINILKAVSMQSILYLGNQQEVAKLGSEGELLKPKKLELNFKQRALFKIQNIE